MRILIDTNIFIPMEDSANVLDAKMAELHRLASGKHQLMVHPASRDDIARDKNVTRREIMLQRLDKYLELESPPLFIPNEEEDLVGLPKKDNDRVDNLILLALHRNCVHWLITLDKGLRKKAKELGEYERVLTVDNAISSLLKLEHEERPLYPNIVDVPCYTLNLNDVFFDTLRIGYDDFDTWFTEKCAKTGRSAWACMNGGLIQAIAVYKPEDSPIVTLDKKGLPGKVLKLCTFKVVKRGYKIGELLLKQAFNYAIENAIEYVYVTVDPGQHILLEDLFSEFGFVEYGTDSKGRDKVLVKEFPSIPPANSMSPLEYAIKYYPAIKVDGNQAFLIPIRPEYHTTLFPELMQQGDFFLSVENSAGNAIKQAYLSHSPIKSVRPGDIIFFYRTKDQMAITTYGVVDQFHIEMEAEAIFQWVAKRTVYSYEDIQKMAGKKVKVILFRLVGHLDNPVEFERLKDLNIVNGPIQSLITLSADKIKLLIKEAGINDCVLPD
jgi:hypothetical protein